MSYTVNKNRLRIKTYILINTKVNSYIFINKCFIKKAN